MSDALKDLLVGGDHMSEEDFQSALEKSQADKVSLMHAIELLRLVRADDSLKHIPFVMITAESKTENVIAAKEAGVSNYIVKPFNAETLKTKLTSVLGDF